ncbi:MAG: hypothetical protein JJ902_22405 [Roseibium sp.]|nr:hypothetical protein [Roseibium sp.]
MTTVTRDGQTWTQRSEEHHRAGPKNPLNRDGLCAKFIDCAASLSGDADRTRFLEALQNL